ncbi:MAG: cation:proton antiporter [Candidatus Marinimicrobia bacterium]|nr:cation:proton antiporter [Candidatus Neomarinimicrobiota bacterium]
MELSSGILLIFGIAVFGGLISAFVVRKLHIPQVLGYILTGLIIGESGFKIVDSKDIINLAPFNYFALGIIGFLVGSEITFSTLKKYGKQFSAILLAEGLLSFILVGLSTGLVLFFVSKDYNVALAGGIVFGAIASATDPASTLNVLQEYRAAGILTTTVIAIVALDDALAMTLYGIGTGVAQMLSGSELSTTKILLHTILELFGSTVIGIIFGYFVILVLHRSNHHESSAAASFALLLLCIGIVNQFKMDVILATMGCGILVVNKAPKRSKEIIQYIKNLSIPIYILFFVLVGARLQVNALPKWLWGIIILYTIFRSIGKYTGCWIGAYFTRSDHKIRNLTGMSIFAQGGVAIGLSIMASQHLNSISVVKGYYLGDVIIFGVTATTFIVQIIGPTCVKIAARLAGETGKNISEEDILNENIIEGNIVSGASVVLESTTLREVFHIFTGTKLDMIPVLGRSRELVGGITINQLKESLIDQESWDWLLASDIMEPVKDVLEKTSTLAQAARMMEQLQTDYIAITEDNGTFSGIITMRKIRDIIKEKQLSILSN